MQEYLIRIQQAVLSFKQLERSDRQLGMRNVEELNEYLNEIDGCSAALRELINNG